MPQKFHSPLSTPSAVRLLRILFISPNDIVVEVVVARLEDNLDFDCFSYVWGTLKLDFTISNQYGASLQITSTLASTLRRIHDTGHRRLIWADGICIDQSNHEERVQQVQLMRQIYTKAKTVIADLGDSFDRVDEAVGLCSLVVENKERLTAPAALYSDTTNQFPASLPVITDSCWSAFRQLIASPWFTRIWIIQEYLVAARVEMLCRDRIFDSNLIFEAARLIFHHQLLGYDKRIYTDLNHNRDFTAATKAGAYLRMLQTSKERLQVHRALDLPLFLQRGITFGATDARDRLFAISALSKIAPSQDITPDYQSAACIVFQRLFRHLARSDMLILIELLHAVGLPRSNSASPTWLPDWTTKATAQSLEPFRTKQFGSNIARPYFRAGIAPRRSKAHVSPLIYMSIDMNILSVRCLMVDNIEAVCDDVFALLDANVSDNAARAEILASWLNEVLHLAQIVHADGEDVWRILIANVSSMDRSNEMQLASSPPSSFSDIYRSFKSYVLGSDNDEISDEVVARAATFLTTMGYVMRGRVFALTSSGRLCLTPADSQKDDALVVVIGACCPFTARRLKSATQEGEDVGGKFHMLGHGYIHGLMKGEAFLEECFQVQVLEFV